MNELYLGLRESGGGGLGTASPAAEGSTGREDGVMYSDSSSFSEASSPVCDLTAGRGLSAQDEESTHTCDCSLSLTGL